MDASGSKDKGVDTSESSNKGDDAVGCAHSSVGDKGKDVETSESLDKGKHAAGGAKDSCGDKKRVFIDLDDIESEPEVERINSKIPKLVQVKVEKERWMTANISMVLLS